MRLIWLNLEITLKAYIELDLNEINKFRILNKFHQ